MTGISSPEAAIDLYWLPLGAGGWSVRRNGRVYEAIAARRAHREVDDLYHSALAVRDGDHEFVIEMAPVWNTDSAQRGVVREGPVGARWLGRSQWFRYEVRLWQDGRIPDAAEAVASPVRTSSSHTQVAMLLQVLPTVPPLIWGRDELGAGEMWNSNSLVSWLLARSGHHMSTIHPPVHGRAPGWKAGLVLASRQGSTVR
jgi:hypothetical protein